MKLATCFFCSATTPLPYSEKALKEWGYGIVIPGKGSRLRDVVPFDLCPVHKDRQEECLLRIIGGVQIAMAL